jgi:hypothetical protein
MDYETPMSSAFSEWTTTYVKLGARDRVRGVVCAHDAGFVTPRG